MRTRLFVTVLLIIVVFVAVGVARVHLRSAEAVARHQIQRLGIRRVALRRQRSDQQVRLGELTTVEAIRRRAADPTMALDLVGLNSDERRRLAQDE